ncbi:protein neuralized-like isoform X1 [Haliotis asinina]|uniref:protein neuralized-like isoform X1 n=1 Tax=Haliotis asinina TaxID=109174 RepID=UPI003531A355
MGIYSLESVVIDCNYTLTKRGSLQRDITFTSHGDNRSSLHVHQQKQGLSGELQSLRSDWPLQFHEVHGDNIDISPDRTRARRIDSFCKGICFSNRPVNINEKVFVKFVDTSSSWSGVLRFGFTNIDPSVLRGAELPRYACPDLTNKPGNWAKALGERYANTNCLLCFWVTRAGDVFYSMNGEDKGVFFSGVITSSPLWALLDIYGNTCAVEFPQDAPDQTVALNNRVQHPNTSSSVSVEQELFSFSSFSVNESTSQLPIVRYHANIDFQHMTFHDNRGKNIRLTADKTIACRLRDEYCNAYVFTSCPLRCGEKVVIQILGIDRSYVGGLAFGMTACDPNRISTDDLPDDSDLLLDRPEYWVVNKDVCRTPDIGDELSFFLTNEGEVRYSRNNHKIATLMHVDRTLPLWAFFDVYGNVQKIKLLGATNPSGNLPRLPRSRSTSSYPGLTVSLPPTANQSNVASHPPPRPPPPTVPPSVLRSFSVPSQATPTSPTGAVPPPPPYPVSMPTSPTSGHGDNQPVFDDTSECTVCYERQVNCVLYTCGHMCMCYECAIAVRKDKGGLCPICRQQIKDVIKIYRS